MTSRSAPPWPLFRGLFIGMLLVSFVRRCALLASARSWRWAGSSTAASWIGLGSRAGHRLLRDRRFHVRTHAGLRRHGGHRGRRWRARLLPSKDLAPWMRPLSLVVFAACVGTIVCHARRGQRLALGERGSSTCSAALIVVDFNYLRGKHGTENDAILASSLASFFVSRFFVNIFISLAQHLPAVDGDAARPRFLATPEDLEARRVAEQDGRPFQLAARRCERAADHPASTTAPARHAGAPRRGGRPPSWDPEVSRQHAELEFKEGEWTPPGHGFSRNGTHVKGLRIHGRRRPKDEDRALGGGSDASLTDPGLSGLGATLGAGRSAPRQSSPSSSSDPARGGPLMGDGGRPTPGPMPRSRRDRIPEEGSPRSSTTSALVRPAGHAAPRPRAEIALLALRSGWPRPRDPECGARGPGRGAPVFEPRDELVELEPFETLADGLELVAQNSTSRLPLLAELERLPAGPPPRSPAGGRSPDARARGLVGQRGRAGAFAEIGQVAPAEIGAGGAGRDRAGGARRDRPVARRARAGRGSSGRPRSASAGRVGRVGHRRRR